MELFPVMTDHGRTEYIPYSVIENHEAQAVRNHGQTLKQLAERGGLDYTEVLAVLEDRSYARMEYNTAKARVHELISERQRGWKGVEVCVLVHCGSVEPCVIGVFASKEKANAKIEELDPEKKRIWLTAIRTIE